MRLTRKSIFTDKENTMEIPLTMEQINAWRDGEKTAFELFPHLDSVQMDFLLTGMTPQEHEQIRAELIQSGEIEDAELAEAQMTYA